jgi:hypothetical protein
MFAIRPAIWQEAAHRRAMFRDMRRRFRDWRRAHAIRTPATSAGR